MRIYNIINIPKGLSPEFECDCQDEYNSGYTQGVQDQKSKLSSLSVSGNGEYVSEDGFSVVHVDVPQEEVHLESLTATLSANGMYDVAVHSGYDGFKSPVSLVVDVPQEEVRLENLFAVLSANGTYDFTARSGYGGFQSPAGAYVNVPQTGHTDQEMEDSWNSGYTSGVTDGYASGYTSGKTDGFDAGYDSGVTDGYTSGKTDAWQPAYDSGYTDGAASVDCQPLYDSGYTDGYSSGRTDGYDDGWRPGYNSGYTDGINAAGGDYASGYTDGFDAGYDSGSTDGYASGYASGRTDGYDDGWQPGYDSGMTDGYGSGYTGGYASGKTDGFGEGYDSGYTDGAASVDCQPLYDSGYTDGYESGHTDGYNERAAMLTAMTITASGAYESVEGWSAVTVNVSGYSRQDLDNAYASGHTSGVTDGAAQQKALLASTAFTTNGTYTRTDGWSSVTVNVPQTGYTQQDLDNAYASGLTNGYDSGWAAGYDSGYTDGLDTCGTDFTKKYLTIEALSAGTLYWKTASSAFTKTIEWSKDEGQSWSSVTSSDIDSGTVITIVQPGDIVMFKGNNSWYCDTHRQTHFLADFDFIVYGNIMSLVESDNFVSSYDFTSVHALCGLFEQNPHLLSAENLILPATGLTEACYEKMFENCTSLTAAPALPATRLADSCYLNMFANCTSLVNAPSLPATTLAHRCYLGMFQYSETLSGAPELPADFVEDESYALMFFNCSNLKYVKCLATGMATPPSGHYYPTYNWLKNVSGTGTFVKDANASWTTGDNGIPTGWNTQDV